MSLEDFYDEPINSPRNKERIKKAIASELFTSNELADILDVSPSYISTLKKIKTISENKKGKGITIALDVDGVLRNFVRKLQEVYDKKLPNESRTVDVTDWDLSKFFSIKDKIWDFIYKENSEEIFLNAKPYRGVKLLVDYLKSNDYIVHIVSAQPDKDSEYFTTMWLKLNNIHYDEIFFTYDKEKLDYDLIIEDSPIMIPKCVKEGKKVIRILRRYNKPVEGSYSCRHYQDVVEKLNELF